MPKNRWILNASKKKEYAQLTNRMLAAGADLAPPEAEAEWIHAYVYPILSAVRSWPHGTVFALSVRLVGIVPKTMIQGFDLSSTGWNFDPYILEDPLPRDWYRMLDGSRFDRREVLNHRLGKDGILRRGDTIEGWVLAECMTAAPARYNRMEWMPLSLSIVNQFEEVQPVSFEMPLESIPDPVRTRGSRTPLFDASRPKSTDTMVRPMDGCLAKPAARRNEKLRI